METVTQEPKPAYRYLRLSEIGDHTTIDDQRKHCQKLEAQNNLICVGEYEDYGDSAFDRDNPLDRNGYAEMLAGLDAGEAVAVTAYRQDRLWRDDLEKSLYTHSVGKRGARWVYVVGNSFDLENPDDDLMLTILNAFAKHESAVKRLRIRNQKAKRRAQGISTQPVVSLGIMGTRHGREKNDGLELWEPEALYVREAARMVLEGVRLTEIAAWFQAQGVPKVRDANKGKPNGSVWLAQEVRSLLTAPRIAGLQAHKGQVIGEPEAWPKIIDRATWERLQAHFSKGRYGAQSPRAGAWSGFVLCARPTEGGGLCGATMRRSTVGKAKRNSYKCHRCHNSVPLHRVEARAHEWLIAAVDSPDFGAMVAGQAPNDAALMAELAEARAELAEWLSMLKAKEVNRAEYVTLKRGTEAHIAGLTRKLRHATAHGALSEWVGNGDALAKLLADPELSADAHRAILMATGHHLWVGPAKSTGRAGFDAERLQIVPDAPMEEAA